MHLGICTDHDGKQRSYLVWRTEKKSGVSFFIYGEPVNGVLGFAGDCNKLESEGMSVFERDSIEKSILLVFSVNLEGSALEMSLAGVLNIFIFTLYISIRLLLGKSTTHDLHCSYDVFSLSSCSPTTILSSFLISICEKSSNLFRVHGFLLSTAASLSFRNAFCKAPVLISFPASFCFLSLWILAFITLSCTFHVCHLEKLSCSPAFFSTEKSGS